MLKYVSPRIYKHYKKGFYKVIGIAKLEETKEKHVIYRALYGEKELWIRPLSIFKENVTLENKKVVPRFKLIKK